MANEYISQDDQELNQAIEASLNYEMYTDLVEDRPLEDRVREKDRLVAASCRKFGALLKVIIQPCGAVSQSSRIHICL
jgi:hypothetical protein